MNLEDLIVDAVAAQSESQQEGTTLVALGLRGVPPQAIEGISLIDGMAIIELCPDSLVQMLLDADLEVAETDGETVNHISFIQTLCQTFMAHGGPLTPEVRAALGRLGRCADFRTVVEAAFAEAPKHDEHAELSGSAG